jgi:hypothetical protein
MTANLAFDHDPLRVSSSVREPHHDCSISRTRSRESVSHRLTAQEQALVCRERNPRATGPARSLGLRWG